MTLTEWGPLSNLAFATATVVYVLAFVAHTAEWASRGPSALTTTRPGDNRPGRV